MRVCLLTDKPEHPLLAALSDLGSRHGIAVLNAGSGAGPADLDPDAELYLLKAHSPQVVALARVAESRGGTVVNSATATELCQDRVRMAERAQSVGLPFPDTYHLTRLSDLSAWLAGSAAPDLPLVVKSRASRRPDLIIRLDRAACLRSLKVDWGDEAVVVQEFIAGDGWDYKLWVIGSRVFAGMRRSPLDTGAPTTTRLLDPRRLPPDWLDLVQTVGDAFGLQIYGVDLLDTAHGPLIVDVNPFPGFRSVPHAPEALTAFVLQAGAATVAPRGVSRPAGSAPDLAKQCQATATAPIAALHQAVGGLITALESTGDDNSKPNPAALRVVAVRRKPRRGLTVTYRTHDRQRTASTPRPLVTARLAEPALDNPCVGELLASVGPAEADNPVLVHGAFKPGQLVFCVPDQQPVITDLDGAGMGDPALDVGCFLAYMRPPGLDRDRGGTRTWYAAARDAFLGAYLAALGSHGAAPDYLAALQRRAAAFEAALLLKIASRRVRRMGSPRPAEVRAAVAGIDLYLERFAERWDE